MVHNQESREGITHPRKGSDAVNARSGALRNFPAKGAWWLVMVRWNTRARRIIITETQVVTNTKEDRFIRQPWHELGLSLNPFVWRVGIGKAGAA